MTADRPEGYDRVADAFVAARSDIGAGLVLSWTQRHLQPGTAILDVGCGSGWPIAAALIEAGYKTYGIDASPRLVDAFRRNCPGQPVVCEAAQDGILFDRPFEATICIGLLFLLSEDDQARVLHRIADALIPGGHLLFSAPREAGTWDDLLTGLASLSLGEAGYMELMAQAGLRPAGCLTDDGGNNYYHAIRNGG